MMGKDRRFARGGRPEGYGNRGQQVGQHPKRQQPAALGGKAKGRVDRRSTGGAKGVPKGRDRSGGYSRREQQQLQHSGVVRKTLGGARRKALDSGHSKQNYHTGWRTKGKGKREPRAAKGSDKGRAAHQAESQRGWRESERYHGWREGTYAPVALELNRKSRDTPRWNGKGSISDALAKGTGKGKGRQDMWLSDDDRRLMQKISIVAHMDTVPKPSRPMQGLASRTMHQIIGSRGGSSRGLGAQVGSNFGR